jgi:hypothetical protein
MRQPSRLGCHSVLAPAFVRDVLRRPGTQLDPKVAGSFGSLSSIGQRMPVPEVGDSVQMSQVDSQAELEAQRRAGSLAGGTGLSPGPAFDFSRIRIHTDARAAEAARAVRARAYTVGSDIVFGEGQYQPNTFEGRHLLAHELVHVIQATTDPAPTLHRYEAPEHQDFGDRGIVELADFLKTKEGTEFARKLGNPASLKDLPSDAFLKGKTFRVKGVELTVGDIIAMAGDFYPSPTDLMNADPEELKEIRAAMKDEREGRLKGGKANERYQELTLKYIRLGKRAGANTFIGMAKVNAPHFTPTNRAAWKDLHKQALKAGRAAGKDQARLDAALLIDTFGGHFLTDAFASGHLFDKKKLEQEISAWLAKNPVAPTNPEMISYYAIIGGNMPQVILKNIHDRLNAEGVEVSNRRGITWKTFGDDHLKDAAESLRIGALAVFESRRQVLEASRAGPAVADGNDDALAEEVLGLLPDQASIDQATAKAVSYIPEAAQTLTPLIYRQRGAGALELKQQWGVPGAALAPIIKANIEAIADPGREKQLLQMEEESRRLNTGKRLAPQFTVATF